MSHQPFKIYLRSQSFTEMQGALTLLSKLGDEVNSYQCGHIWINKSGQTPPTCPYCQNYEESANHRNLDKIAQLETSCSDLNDQLKKANDGLDIHEKHYHKRLEEVRSLEAKIKDLYVVIKTLAKCIHG